jgi:hypothetical protein
MTTDRKQKYSEGNCPSVTVHKDFHRIEKPVARRLIYDDMAMQLVCVSDLLETKTDIPPPPKFSDPGIHLEK